MPALTADTITDEQIRELWASLTAHESAGIPIDGVKECIVALKLDDESEAPQQRAARARCAEILNTRANGGTP